MESTVKGYLGSDFSHIGTIVHLSCLSRTQVSLAECLLHLIMCCSAGHFKSTVGSSTTPHCSGVQTVPTVEQPGIFSHSKHIQANLEGVSRVWVCRLSKVWNVTTCRPYLLFVLGGLPMQGIQNRRCWVGRLAGLDGGGEGILTFYGSVFLGAGRAKGARKPSSAQRPLQTPES